MQAATGSADQRAWRNVAPLAIATLIWIATLAVAQFGPTLLWDRQPIPTWIAVGANLVAGAAWIVVHARYLRGVDELQRKIMTDAIAVALGVGLVVGFAYAAVSTADLITLDSDIAFITVLMGVVYMIAVAVGTVRYR